MYYILTDSEMIRIILWFLLRMPCGIIKLKTTTKVLAFEKLITRVTETRLQI